MQTKDRLAQALRDLDITDMADLAANGFYDETSPVPSAIKRLIKDLAGKAAEAQEHFGIINEPAKRILALRERAIDGEFRSCCPA